MNLQEHYQKLWTESIGQIAEGAVNLDKQIDNPRDNRFGITLLARPDHKTLGLIQEFCRELKIIEPDQYYYPNADIHLTILSIISCYEGFDLNNIDVNKYIDRIAAACAELESFKINYHGITVTPSAVLIQGFPEGDTLEKLRDNVRRSFKDSNLEQSIDARYKLETAHVTVTRFKNPLENPASFVQKLNEYRDFSFGCSQVDNVELVFNDWYQRSSLVKELGVLSWVPNINRFDTQ